MSSVAPIVRHEVLSLRRERMPQLLLMVFVAMVTISSALGWLASSTVGAVWRETVRAGLTSAADPFGAVSPLFFARNTVIYVVLIGALSAIVLGAASGLRDRRAGSADLVLSRSVGVRALLVGKLFGLAEVLAVASAAGFAVSWVSVSVITGSPLAMVETLRMLAFFALSLMLLGGFAALGLMSGLRSRSSTSALLLPTALWALLTFLLPQVATGANPVSLLNPVPAPPATDPAFGVLHGLLGPLLVTEQFKTVSGVLLRNPDVSGAVAPALLSVLGATGIVIALALLMPRRALREALRD